MAENSYFFNSSYSDERTYRAEDFARYFESVLSSGIMPNFDGIRGATDGEYGLNVTNYIGSLRVGVKAGHAIIKGHRYELSGEERLTLRPTTGATVNRIDRIVLRLDRRASARYIKLFVVEGQEAYSAEPPALMRNANVHEISLAQVHITGGQSYIDKIVDERLDESVCGIANSLINVPTSQFVEQFNTWFNSYTDDAQSEFDTWFDSVKDVIDDSLANRLLQAMQELETKKADKTEVNALATEKADKTEVEKKVDRTYFDMIVASLVDGGPRELFYSVAALQMKYPNGEAGTYLVFDSSFTDGAHTFMWNGTTWEDLGVYQAEALAYKSVTRDKIADNAVTIDKLESGLLKRESSLNLYNPSDVTVGGYYNANGVWVSDTTWSSASVKNIEHGKTYTKNGEGGIITFWDAKGIFVASLQATTTFTVPSSKNIVDMRFATRDNVNQMLVEAENLPIDYVPYANQVAVDKLDVSTNLITHMYTAGEKVLEGSHFTRKGYYNISTGEWTASEYVFSSDKIATLKGSKWYKNFGGSVTYFDKDGKFITGVDVSKGYFTVTVDASYAVLALNTDIVSASQAHVIYLSGMELAKKFGDETARFDFDFIADKLEFFADINKVSEQDNLMNMSSLRQGYYNRLTGEWVSYATTYSSGFIPCFEGALYTKNFKGSVIYFGENYNFLSGVELNANIEFSPAHAARYMVLSFSNLTQSESPYCVCVNGKHRQYKANHDVIIDNSIKTVNSETYLKIPTPYDDGIEWEGRTHQSTHPSDVHFPSGWNGWKYWKAHTPYPNQNSYYENPCIAVSNDGYVWTVPEGLENPLATAPSGGYNSDTDLFYNADNNTLEVWWRAVTQGSTTEVLRRRTTTDGINWTETEDMLTITSDNVLKVLSPSLHRKNSKYHMYFVRDWYIMYMESDNGKVWSEPQYIKINGENVHSWHIEVRERNGVYHLLNCDKYTNGGAGGELKYSTSADGINFSEQITLIKPTGNAWDYDGLGVYRGSLVFDNTGVKLYYGMYHKSKTGRNIWLLGMCVGETIYGLRGVTNKMLDYYGVN